MYEVGEVRSVGSVPLAVSTSCETFVSVSSRISAPSFASAFHAANCVSFPRVGVDWSWSHCVEKSSMAAFAFGSASMRVACMAIASGVASSLPAAAAIKVASGTERHKNSDSRPAISNDVSDVTVPSATPAPSSRTYRNRGDSRTAVINA
jgi:hypothetical protein